MLDEGLNGCNHCQEGGLKGGNECKRVTVKWKEMMMMIKKRREGRGS